MAGGILDNSLNFVLKVLPDTSLFDKGLNALGLRASSPISVPVKHDEEAEHRANASSAAGVASSVLVGTNANEMKLWNKVLTDLQKPLGPLNIGFDLLEKGLSKATSLVKGVPFLGKVLGSFGDELTKCVGPAKEVTESLIAMSAKANPGQFKLWARSLDDVQATVGGRFIPVLAKMTEWVDKFGDVLATILPNTAEVEEALKPLFDSLTEFKSALSDLNSEAGPLFREILILGLKQFASVASGLVDVLSWASKKLTEFTKVLRIVAEFAGIKVPPPGERQRDFAAQPASFQGLGQYEQSFQAQAFSSGGQQDIAEKRHDEIKSPLDLIASKLETLSTDLFVKFRAGFQILSNPVDALARLEIEGIRGFLKFWKG